MAIELDATDPAPATGPETPARGQLTPPRVLAVTTTATAAGQPLPAPTASVAPGTRLAHFEILRPLGHGGMGEVYLATDLALERPVALKLLPPSVAADPGRRARLLREARAQARINHPNVCHIYFIGEERGQLFFAMEYVEGQTVAQLLERGPLPPDEALELARMAALGLREAQRHGFTHRDIKPSNLMVDGHGLLKVMDFGLVTLGEPPPTHAATADTADTADTAADRAPLPAATALVGTPLYMAPEQGQGRPVDHRADIYALGATLHHMIAGAPPFTGATAADLLSQHATVPRSSLITRTRGRRTVGVVDALVDRMMAKRPEDRPASYDELLGELERASRLRSRPAGFWARAAAAALDLAVVGLLMLPWSAVFDGADGTAWLLVYTLVVLPLALARAGTTPGHALLELEIVDARSDRRLSYQQGAIRMLVMSSGIIASELAETASHLGPGAGPLDVAATVFGIAGFVVPLAELARASWRTPDRRTLWDRAAGSRVRYRLGPTGRGGAAITVKAAQVVATGGKASGGSASARAT